MIEIDDVDGRGPNVEHNTHNTKSAAHSLHSQFQPDGSATATCCTYKHIASNENPNILATNFENNISKFTLRYFGIMNHFVSFRPMNTSSTSTYVNMLSAILYGDRISHCYFASSGGGFFTLSVVPLLVMHLQAS